MEWKNSLRGKKKLGSVKPVVNCFPVITVSVLIVILKNFEIKNRDTDEKRLIALSDHEFREPPFGMFEVKDI
jgi:hypothetical protein